MSSAAIKSSGDIAKPVEGVPAERPPSTGCTPFNCSRYARQGPAELWTMARGTEDGSSEPFEQVARELTCSMEHLGEQRAKNYLFFIHTGGSEEQLVCSEELGEQQLVCIDTFKATQEKFHAFVISVAGGSGREDQSRSFEAWKLQLSPECCFEPCCSLQVLPQPRCDAALLCFSAALVSVQCCFALLQCCFALLKR